MPCGRLVLHLQLEPNACWEEETPVAEETGAAVVQPEALVNEGEAEARRQEEIARATKTLVREDAVHAAEEARLVEEEVARAAAAVAASEQEAARATEAEAARLAQEEIAPDAMEGTDPEALQKLLTVEKFDYEK